MCGEERTNGDNKKSGVKKVNRRTHHRLWLRLVPGFAKVFKLLVPHCNSMFQISEKLFFIISKLLLI